MPMAPPRACPRCGGLVTDARPCTCTPRPPVEAWRREADRARGTAHARGYTARWARYAQEFRARFPFCGMRADGSFSAEHSLCVQQGNYRSLVACVDHIVAIRDGGSMWDLHNHQSLCTRCNLRKG